MSLGAAGRYPRYRAPTGDGQTLCIPPWDKAGELVARNCEAIESRSGDLLGHSLAELTQAARAAVLASALEYTRSYADDITQHCATVPFVLTGHQPGFVHPGVWLKNFAADQLARRAGGVAISLVIDSDLCRSTSIVVPAGDVAHPRAEHVQFDAGMAQMAWEERPLVDGEAWNQFGPRAAETIAPFVAEPLVREWWPTVIADAPGRGKLALALSRARHRLELEWGSQSLEIPQSVVCQTTPFRKFAVSLLAEAVKFRTVHNQALTEYRREHQLRNHAQPVPDLGVDDGWIEAPFWLWSASDPMRRGVFVRMRGNELHVSDRAGFNEVLPCRETDAAVQRLGEWEARGVKLRTRALVTTMFARLFLADVFIHGIGGAKYDQVTDEICERLFGLRPPAHLTLSGTLRLPIPHVVEPLSRERHLRQALRNMEFHPEKAPVDWSALPNDRGRWQEFVEQKRSWLTTAKTPENAATRHRQIVAANAGLAAWTALAQDKLRQELVEFNERRESNQILESREYAFCLFPRELLRKFLLDFSQRMP